MEDTTSNINRLKEMILDEGNLVTYISLSKYLGVHVNESKMLLQMFLDSIRREMPHLQLNINYLLSGVVDENKAKLTVCLENDLEAIKKSYKVTYFQHIYSISKGLPQTDHAALVTLNKLNDFNLCSGIIKSEYCVKRSSKEIDILKSSSQEVIDQKPILVQNKTAKTPAPKMSNTNSDKVVKTESYPEKQIKKEIVSPQKENINKQSVNKSVPQKGIAGFFNKQNGNAKKKENKAPEKTTQITLSMKDEAHKMDIDENEISDSKVDIKSNGELNGNNKILNQIKKKSKVDKKRKRVLHVSDSESEEENDPFIGNNEEVDANKMIYESDDEIPPTPAASNLKITTGIVNPRKKRKVVDKTYMSDDGYIITKREEVYESCSDGETNTEKSVESVKREVKQEKLEVSPKLKQSETKSKKKISPPQKGKQSSIMNFFKKN